MPDSELAQILSDLYPDEAGSLEMANRAGIHTGRIYSSQKAVTRWYYIVAEARKAGLVRSLIRVALADYPNHAGLLSAVQSVDMPDVPLLIVAIGDDAPLKFDLSAVREVRRLTGMKFRRILNATLAKLKTALNRQREHGLESNVHLSVHSGPSGVELGGMIIDAEMLSNIMPGVQTLVLAGCENDAMVDYLGVVPFVIGFSEEIGHEDATAFSRLFWAGIGAGLLPPDALAEALEKAPAELSEFVVSSF